MCDKYVEQNRLNANFAGFSLSSSLIFHYNAAVKPVTMHESQFRLAAAERQQLWRIAESRPDDAGRFDRRQSS